MHVSYSQKKLEKIWDQVPVDYYEEGERKNIGQYLWHSHKRRIFSRVFDTIRKKFSKNDHTIRVLDLGCADGHLTHWLAEKWPGAKVVGIDPSKKLISAAQKKYPQAQFVVADGHKLPFKTKSFDLVVCSEVLEHVVDPAKVCQEITRVLAPGGYLIAELDTGNWLFSFLWFFWTRYGGGKVWQNAHLHQFDPQSLPKVVSSSGLTVTQHIHHHLGMAITVVARKKTQRRSSSS